MMGILSVVLAAMALEPAAIFSDHAVLLRSKDTPVFGFAEPGKSVSVQLSDAHATATANAEGRWLARLDLNAVEGNGPFDLVMNECVAHDVLLGEVWLCSGQSNMSFEMPNADDFAAEKKTTTPLMRCFITHGWTADAPQVKSGGHWVCALKDEPHAWTAVGYHFGKELAVALQRPIGLVNASVGASSLESWIDASTFKPSSLAARAAFDAEVDAANGYADYERACQSARMAWAAANGRADRPHAATPEGLAWHELSAAELAGLSRQGGAYWFKRTIPLNETRGKAHEVKYARFVERIWNFNLAQVEVYWNGQRLTERLSKNKLDVHARCYDVPAEAALAKNTLLVRAYDCDWTRQLPYAFMLDGKRLPETGWSLADEFVLPPMTAEARRTQPARQYHRLTQNMPCSLYNGKIAAIVPMGLSGVIWYQGESNAARAKEYHALFPAFIDHWRQLFAKPLLPFAWCQLAAYEPKVTDANKPYAARMPKSDWMGVRDAQDKALALPMTGQAVLIDAGEEKDIHPRDKRTPGKRLAAWALNQVYGKTDVVCVGPRVKEATVQNGVVTVAFDDAVGGLVTHDLGATYVVRSRDNLTAPVKRNSPQAQVEGFSLAGADGVWHWADQAEIVGKDRIAVSAKAVPHPVCVRYGWAINPWVNLCNAAGFPAVPFERKIESPLEFLPLGAVRPEGHLLKQLERQRDGLTGHAEELYPDIGKSDWLTKAGVGGQYAWERGPYYARGLVALAFVLDDAALKAKARKWVESALASQRPDGDFGPRTNNWWANMLPQAYLREWADATGDTRVVPFLEKYYAYQERTLPQVSLLKESCWACARGGDEIQTVLWLYAHTGNPRWLAFARMLCSQTADWTTYYERGGDPRNGAGYRCHIVNFMQGLKYPALRYRLFGEERDRAAYARAFASDGWVMRTCGRPDGMINGSEPLTDRSASGGTELCAIAERMLSIRTILGIMGDAPFADDLEEMAYNALPATIAPDGKGIRYYLMLNQPMCVDKTLMFANNGWGDQVTGANCPGPHSGFGCCRSNGHVAAPTFVQTMWAKKEGGLALVAHGPSRVTTQIGGQTVSFRAETDYPYSGRVTVRMLEGGGTFPLFVRVPRWAKVKDAGTFRRYDRTWKAGDTVDLDFPMAVEVSHWANDAVCVRRGPLLYALQIAHDWQKVETYKVPYEKRVIKNFGGDFPRWQILPKSPWNYALLLDAAGKLAGLEEVDAHTLRAKAVRTESGGWGYMREGASGRAIDPPPSPVNAADCSRKAETVTLVPLADTQIRITLFPWTPEM